MNKRWITYLLLLVVLSVLAVAYLQKELTVILAVFIGLPMCSAIFLPLLWWAVVLDGEMLLPQTGMVDEKVGCCLQVKNRGVLPVSMVCCILEISYETQKVRVKCKKAFSMRMRETAKINIPITFSCCGPVSVTVKKLQIFEYLTIFCMNRSVKQSKQMIVLPKVVYTNIRNREINMNDISHSDRYHATKAGDDPSEILAIRKFRAGDKLQKVHWKITAKMDEMMVKEFASPISCKIGIFIDLNYKTLSSYHARMTVVMSLGMSLLNADCCFMFVWAQAGGELHHTIIFELEELYEAFSYLLYHSAQETERNLYSVLDELRYPERFRQILYVCGDMKKEEATELLQQRNSFADEMYILSVCETEATCKAIAKDLGYTEENAKPEMRLARDNIFWMCEKKLKNQLQKTELTVM